MKKKRLLLIDSHALIFRAYYSIPSRLSTVGGEQVNAVFGFTRLLLDVLKKFKPEYVICAFDSKGPTIRHKMYADYKGTRQKPDQELLDQIPMVKEVVKSLNIPLFEYQGYEADDLLGTLVNHSETDVVEKIIVTGDHDLLQLVEPGTEVYISGGRFNGAKLYDKEGVIEKFGFGPEFVIDYKAIRGDASDNIPGIKGIGDKGAKLLIEKFGHLEEILANSSQVESKSMRSKLESGVKISKLSKKLATIITDISLEFKLSDAELADYDEDVMEELFMEYGFKSLIAKLPKSNGKALAPQPPKGGVVQSTIPNADSPFRGLGGLQMDMFGEKMVEGSHFENLSMTMRNDKYILINSIDEFNMFYSQILKSKEFAYDCETTGSDAISVDVLGISFAVKEGHAWYINLNADWFVEEHVKKLRSLFEDRSIQKIGHNLKYDAHVLLNKTIRGVSLNIKLENYFFDTMIAAYLLGGGEWALGLKTLAYSQLGETMVELEDLWGKEGGKVKAGEIKDKMLGIPVESLSQYACADADMTFRLYQKFSKLMNENTELSKLFFDIEIPLIKMLLRMERNGIRLNVEYLRNYGREMNKELINIQQEIFDEIGFSFNLASPKQVGEVLFDKLELPNGKKTKTGAWQTNERVLRELEGAHVIVDKLLRYRELSKLNSTYVESLIKQVNSDSGKVHSQFNQTVAQTGRLSSSKPNMQNIPTATEDGLKIKKAFVAEKGRKLVAFDISQQELRILAHMSNESALIEAFENNIDVHALTASRIFDKELGEVTKEERGRGKTLNFSLMYGISEYGLAKRLKIETEEAKELIDGYFDSYTGVKKFYDKLLADAKESGRVSTMFGRWRPTAGLLSKNFRIKSATTREVMNFPIQGSAADMIKIAIVQVGDFLLKNDVAKQLNVKLILQIHDELIFEVDDSPEDIELFGKEIIKIMENSVELAVPVKATMVVGDNLAELK